MGTGNLEQVAGAPVAGPIVTDYMDFEQTKTAGENSIPPA